MSWASTGCICDGAPELLFTENESNAQRLWGQPNASPYVKDAFHAYIISGRGEAVNPAKTGTKAAAHYVLDVPGGGSKTVRLRLAAAKMKDAFGGFEKIFNSRIADADEFYDRIVAQLAERRSAPGAPPGAGGDAVGQAVLLLRPGALAARAQESSAARVRPPRCAQHGMVPHAQQRRDLHAGQVGVSVVCGLGSGVPHDLPGAGGF